LDPILDKAREGQNLLERLAHKIPGFKGYRERELRRDADALQREHLASRLEQNKSVLNELASKATRSGSLDVINDIETARKRLDKVIARIRYADRGYSGFFDAIKVDETMLGRVYQFDLDLLTDIDGVQAAAQQASGAADGKAALGALVSQIDALDARLVEREGILSGVR
jgi:hypothetical protein